MRALSLLLQMVKITPRLLYHGSRLIWFRLRIRLRRRFYNWGQR